MKKIFLCSLRITVGSVFMISGFMKLLAPQGNFLSVILRLEIMSYPWASVLSVFFPWAEFVLGVFLVLGLCSRFALFGLWIFSSIFIGVLSSAIIRKLPLEDCGCFGDKISFSVPQTLLLDLILWGAFLLLSFSLDKALRFSFDEHLDKKP